MLPGRHNLGGKLFAPRRQRQREPASHSQYEEGVRDRNTPLQVPAQGALPPTRANLRYTSSRRIRAELSALRL